MNLLKKEKLWKEKLKQQKKNYPAKWKFSKRSYGPSKWVQNIFCGIYKYLNWESSLSAVFTSREKLWKLISFRLVTSSQLKENVHIKKVQKSLLEKILKLRGKSLIILKIYEFEKDIEKLKAKWGTLVNKTL